jgi:hypothetical protein
MTTSKNPHILTKLFDNNQTWANHVTKDDPEYETYKTQGEINVVGENWFISNDNQNYSKIIMLGWIKDSDTPANGLLYLPYSQENHKLFFNSSQSNILLHTVNVTWSFTQPESKVNSLVLYTNKEYVPSLILTGGNHKNMYRKYNKSRKYNKGRKYNKTRKYYTT